MGIAKINIKRRPREFPGYLCLYNNLVSDIAHNQYASLLAYRFIRKKQQFHGLVLSELQKYSTSRVLLIIFTIVKEYYDHKVEKYKSILPMSKKITDSVKLYLSRSI